jgi:addiction module HigA family antidote
MVKSQHPGVFLSQEIEKYGLTMNALALKLRVPSNRISGIVNGERTITTDTALRLSRYFGTSAAYWLKLQQDYDLCVAMEENLVTINKEVPIGVK